MLTHTNLKKMEQVVGPNSLVEITLPIDIRFGAVGKTDKGVFIQSVNGAHLSGTAFGAEYSSSDTYKFLPPVHLPSKYEYYAVSVAKAGIIHCKNAGVRLTPGCQILKCCNDTAVFQLHCGVAETLQWCCPHTGRPRLPVLPL